MAFICTCTMWGNTRLLGCSHFLQLKLPKNKKEKQTKINKLKQEKNLFADMRFELNT